MTNHTTFTSLLIAGSLFAACNLKQSFNCEGEDEKLRLAVEAGDLEKATLLLEKKGKKLNIDVSCMAHRTRLQTAALQGNVKMVKLLLDKKARINEKNDAGNTALMFAAFGGHVDVVKLLLSQDADFGIANNAGDTAFEIAHNQGHKDLAEILMTTTDESGRTPLHRAARYNYTKTAKCLIKQGANVNSKNNNNNTVLFVAAKYGSKDIVELLIANEAQVNIANKQGWTPLRIATRYGYTEIVKLLFDCKDEEWVKERVNEKINGRALMHLAAKYNHVDTAYLLIENGADVNIEDKVGYSPLYWAVDKNNIDVAELLLLNGADANKKCNHDTMLSVARYKENNEMVELLKTYGAVAK